LKPAEKRKSLSLLFFRKEDSFLPCRARFDIAPPARAYGPGTDRKDIGMIIDMKGRKAIVTGSTAGIGRATAEGLARAGAAIRQMRQDFPAADISGVAADLSTAEGAEAVFAQAPDADILVNNVGTAVLRNFADTTDEDWQSIFQINFFSGVRMTRHYLPGMVERGWGRVVFVSSESGVNIPKEMIDYGVTKTAQLALSRGLAEASAGTGVTVNAVLPGPTRSEILGNWMAAQAKDNGITQAQAEQAFLTSARPTSLIQRFATTDEVANMIVYLCSEQASATTGAALRVDGGVVRFVA
jgi:NAD(P)-dependent dehydrogenase (short-subunit alcohol dehydrogenase family)